MICGIVVVNKLCLELYCHLRPLPRRSESPVKKVIEPHRI